MPHQISTETEHLSKLKTMQCEVERADTLAMQFEVGVVLAGIILNMLVFLMGIVIESLGNMCNMRISVVSHFICFYGFMSFLDPVR